MKEQRTKEKKKKVELGLSAFLSQPTALKLEQNLKITISKVDKNINQNKNNERKITKSQINRGEHAGTPRQNFWRENKIAKNGKKKVGLIRVHILYAYMSTSTNDTYFLSNIVRYHSMKMQVKKMREGISRSGKLMRTSFTIVVVTHSQCSNQMTWRGLLNSYLGLVYST